ncbi:MAG: PSD1 domain-containing protein [Pirellulales bacterium]|nr:PSD1 domain-containing protein [Pirellulales bacterium]
MPGRSFAIVLLFLSSLHSWSATASANEQPIEFNRDIRPILSDNCYFCHGPDKNKREADLRLDQQEDLLGESSAGPVITPGEPDESELWRRLTSPDADEHMPPAASAKVLSGAQLDLIRRWIEQGAPWEGHWSFTPVRRPAPPEIDGTAAASPIDAFLLRDLVARKLQFSPAAPPHVLARRLAFDLTGLPPTREEVEAFAADSSPAAYEAFVDRLLASPRFGERMAVWWLDLVRYADTVGYHGDQPVSVYPFRDWVIEAFNANKRFDEFTREQLAGDLMPDPTMAQRIASGYNRLGMMSAEGGVQDKEYRAKYAAERVRNASLTWMGSTLGCAECHDHKYDPFTAKDFYRFEAIFADIKERGFYGGANVSGDWGPKLQVPSPEQASQLAELDSQIASVQRELKRQTPELDAALAAWEATQVLWTMLRPAELSSLAGVTLTVQEDGSVLASGTNPPNDTYTVRFADVPAGVTAIRMEVLPHDSLPTKGPGRAGNGNFVLTELGATLRAADTESDVPVKFSAAEASHEQTIAAEMNPYGKWTAAAAIDGDAKGKSWGWAILEQAGKPNQALFQTEGELPGESGAFLTLILAQNLETSQHTIGRFRISVTTAPQPVTLANSPPEEIAAIVATPRETRTEKQAKTLAAHFRAVTPLLQPQRDRLKRLEADRDTLNKQIPTTLVTESVEPRPIRLLARGNWMDETGEIVSSGVPEFLPQPPASEARFTRLDLAHWLTSPENPLVARVFVNRIWKLLFGAGLSRRVDDLGAQGDWPTHPELLDYLAGEFIDSGWDIKRLIKGIVVSDAYRQSSEVSPELFATDPENHWWARQGRYRLDAEFVRDTALAVSGLLVEQVGGPSVKPYQPPGYWAYLNFPTREWENGAGVELYRRGLYTHWQRQYLHPSLLAFDAPSREECAADRPRSNTPLQSLVLLNDPSYVEAARVFAELVLRSGDTSPAARLDWAFQRALSRPVTPREAEILISLVEKHHAQFAAEPKSADELLYVGARPLPGDLNRIELAAWTSVCRAILNLHETVTRN